MADQTLTQIRSGAPATAAVGDILYGVRGTTPKGLLSEDISKLGGSEVRARTKQHYAALTTLTTTWTDIAVNGGFATDTDWTKGDGWSISAGVASCDGTQASTSDLVNIHVIPVRATGSYEVIFTLSNYSAGTITPYVGATAGTARSTNATHTETIVATDDTALTFVASADFVGDIDVVSIELEGIDWDLDDNQVTSLTLDGNHDFEIPGNMKAGAKYTIFVIQDGTGTRLITWHAVFQWTDDIAPTLTTTAGATDILQFWSDGINMFGELVGANYS